MTAPETGRSRLRARSLVILAALVLTAGISVAPSAADIPPDAANHPLLQPLDAQKWNIHSDQTWDDYVKVRPDA